MKTDKNTWKGFFFFLLRLISVAIVICGMYYAYDAYRSYKYDITAEDYLEGVDNLYNGLLDILQDSKKRFQ